MREGDRERPTDYRSGRPARSSAASLRKIRRPERGADDRAAGLRRVTIASLYYPNSPIQIDPKTDYRYPQRQLRAPGKNGEIPSRSRRCNWGLASRTPLFISRRTWDGKERPFDTQKPEDLLATVRSHGQSLIRPDPRFRPRGLGHYLHQAHCYA